MGGDITNTFLGASGIIVEMFLISVSIEIIIESLKNAKGLGTIVGFITNGPEMLCLIVGLVVGDILFAASTPLGSNFMNPLLLILAALLNHKALVVWKTSRRFALLTIGFTAVLAVLFFLIPQKYYLIWVVVSFMVTFVLFLKRPKEPEAEEVEIVAVSKWTLLPSILLLVIAGYFLDPVVSFASVNSHAPKGVIGFVVLATLTSWPEFKSSLSLLRRGKILAAILNITVSNITNIWLAGSGTLVYLMF